MSEFMFKRSNATFTLLRIRIKHITTVLLDLNNITLILMDNNVAIMAIYNNLACKDGLSYSNDKAVKNT